MIEGHLDLAGIEVAAGNVDEAGLHLAAAEGLNPDTVHGWDPIFLRLRAEIASLRGPVAEALGLAEQAVALDNDRLVVRNQCSPLALLGNAQLAIGEPELAVATFEQLITQAGIVPYPCRQAAGYEGAAAAHAALGRLEEAAEHLAHATDIRQRTRSKRIPRPAVDEHLAHLAAEGLVDEATTEETSHHVG